MIAGLIRGGAPDDIEPSKTEFRAPEAYDARPLSTFPLSGTMVIKTGINNFIEIERNFCSNRKLINSSNDEVITQIISYSPTQRETILERGQLSTDAHVANIGPIIRRQEPSDSSVKGSAFDSFSNIALEESNYRVVGGKLEVAKVNYSPVLEAMPENAGFTFLKNPPCVQFL